MNYKKYDKKYTPIVLNEEFRKLLNFANLWFDSDKEKQSLKYRLKDLYFRNISLPLFRRSVYNLIRKNLSLLFSAKNANDIKYIINQFVISILKFTHEYELDLYEDLINKMNFTIDKKGMFDIKFNYEKSTAYEIINSYSINFSFISHNKNYHKGDYIRLLYNVDLSNTKANLIVKIYDYDKKNNSIVDNMYKYYKNFDIPSSGVIENPNYVYDDNLKKDEYNESKLLLSLALQPLAVIVMEIFNIGEKVSD